MEVAGFEFGVAAAKCAPDELATGGGYLVDDTAGPFPLFVQDMGIPLDAPDTWSLTVFNQNEEGMFIRAFAECAKLVDVP